MHVTYDTIFALLGLSNYFAFISGLYYLILLSAISLRHELSKMLVFSGSTRKKIEPNQVNLLSNFNYWITMT